MEKFRITFAESVEMIKSVVDTVFDQDETTGKLTYLPENYDYAFRLNIAHYYDDYQTTGDVNKDYNTAMEIDPDSATIDQKQLRGIENAIKEKIEMKKAEINQKNITVTSQLDNLFEEFMPTLEKFTKTLTGKLSKINTKKINEKIESMNMENLVKMYMESSFADENRNSLLDAKNKKIVDLQAKLNAFTGRNAFADKK